MTFIHWTSIFAASKCSSTGNIGLPALLLLFYYSWHSSQSGLFKTSIKNSYSLPAVLKYRAKIAPHNLASASATELISPNFPFHPPGFIYSKRPSVLQKVPHLRSFAHAIFLVENALYCKSVKLLLMQISVWKSCFLTTQSNVVTSYYVILFHFCVSLIISWHVWFLVSLLSAHPPFSGYVGKESFENSDLFLSHSWLYPQCLKKSLAQRWQPIPTSRRITTINKTQFLYPPGAYNQAYLSLCLPDVSLQLTKQMYFAFGESENSYLNCPMPQAQHPCINEDLALGAGITIFTLYSQLSHLYQHPKHVHSPWQPLALSACISPGRQRMDGPSDQYSAPWEGLQKPSPWDRERNFIPKLFKNQQFSYFPLTHPAI